MDGNDFVIFLFDSFFQSSVVYRSIQRNDGGSLFMAYDGTVDLRQGFQGLLHGHFTVIAHHSLDIDCLFHGFFLLGFDSSGFNFSIMPIVVDFDGIQPERIHADAEAGKRHRGGSVNGLHHDSIKTHCQGDADNIVDECPAEILMDIADGCPAEPYRRSYVQQTTLHENDIGSIDRDISSRPDGDPDIGLGQSRGIIDAVAHHCRLSLCAQLPDLLLLSVRQHAGNHFIHAGAPADGFCGHFIVSGQHHNANSHILKLADGFRTVVLQRISYGDKPQKLRIPGKGEGCFAFGSEAAGFGKHDIRHRHQRSNVLDIAGEYRIVIS